MSRAAKVAIIPLFLLQLLLFVFIAQHRFVDTDEGYFLLASRLVLMHKRPYVDFFFQQAPLLPYVYALWLKIFHVTWFWARLLPAILTALLGTLLYEDVYRQTKQYLAGVASVVLFATSTLVFAWMPIVKPYSLAGLFLFTAYVAVTRESAKRSLWLAAGGLSLALAVDTRSYLVLTAPLFLWWLVRNSSDRVRAVAPFLIGFLVGLLPSLYLFLVSPAAFLFDNLGYHAIRTDAGLVGMWGQKLVVVLMLLLGGPEGNGIQNCLLFVISLAFIFSISRPGGPARFAFQLALLLAITSLLPTPVLPQYFSFCVPFLVVSTVCVVSRLFSNLSTVKSRQVAAFGCVMLTVTYAMLSIGDFRKYLVTGDGIPTVRTLNDPDNWRLERIEEISRAVDAIAAPGEPVASFWSGYLFQTHAVPVPGLETDCGLLIADKLSHDRRAHYHIASWEDLDSAFAVNQPRIVVLENHAGRENSLVPGVLGKTAINALLGHGYTIAQSFGETAIFVSKPNPR